MEVLKISKGGQISIPARVRRRWGVQRLILEDHDDLLVLTPLPDRPLQAARGMFRHHEGPSSQAVMDELRAEEAEAERRKSGDRS